MITFGIAGWSGSGKTTLLERLIGHFTGHGLSVSSVKHAHMGFDMDQPGKDSHRHRLAGAREVLVSSPMRWALLHELRGAPEPDLPALLGAMSPVDLVLVEGFKHAGHDKFEVHDPALGKPPLADTDPRIIGIAWAGPPPVDPVVPVFGRDDVNQISKFILAHTGLG